LTLARLVGVRGVVGAWVSASGLRREAARRLPRPRKGLLGGRPPPGIFSRWGHVTRSHIIIGWLFRPLCVTMTYGLRMSRLGASEECYIAHNVHLCPDLAKKPNVKVCYEYSYNDSGALVGTFIRVYNFFWFNRRGAAK